MLSPNAKHIFELKYAKNLLYANRKEEWKEAVTRVANYIASAEKVEENQYRLMAFFIKVMYDKSFIPGGRILANAGTRIKNLMNCFVIPIDDSRKSIYKALMDASEVFSWGGGVGYNFSKLRAEGSSLSTSDGLASGPLGFMGLFDQTGEVISQASRRGAQMGILNIDHPDIDKFIRFKNELNSRNDRLVTNYIKNLENMDLNIDGTPYFETMIKTLADDQLTHFNLSVGITDDFMEADKANASWNLGKNKIWAKDLLDAIATSAWESGDPGLFFIDAANRNNIAPYLGRLEATNPCGEIPLLPYEACCLGSINLANCVWNGEFDWEYFENVVRVAVRFLDNVHDLNETPVPEINETCKRTRRLGLGVMGLADCLVELGYSYDSDKAMGFCADLAYEFGKLSWKASMDIAEEKGPFPAFDSEKINWSQIKKFDLPRKPVRNIAVTAIAPTGTIALLADVSSGIEPFFALSYKRHITKGVGNSPVETLVYELPLLKQKRDEGWSEDEINKVFKDSHSIPWQKHLEMQAIWQNFIDNAVSKTINMPNDARIGDVLQAYRSAWELGLKGITVYRDKSKTFQVLER
jgi:ribonucleoside-diphosphate reductase alpha chain